MKIEIIKDGNKSIGWKLLPSTEEEHEIAVTIRNLQFFGFDGTEIVYKGIELINPEKGKVFGNMKSISWIQKEHS